MCSVLLKSEPFKRAGWLSGKIGLGRTLLKNNSDTCKEKLVSFVTYPMCNRTVVKEVVIFFLSPKPLRS